MKQIDQELTEILRVKDARKIGSHSKKQNAILVRTDASFILKGSA